jgi:Ni/Fe-hydrogenase subunit HybB-like protein
VEHTLSQGLYAVLQQVTGYIYPNEVELQWSILIVVYPYITGLVAGAFILASLERVFKVKEVEPTYRLALLTALAFLLIAPLPLQLHLGHPERGYEILITPNAHSAMAMFGFVYAWYLTVVLLLEIWFDYRKDLVIWARSEHGVMKWIHLILTLGATDISEKSVEFDRKAVRFITLLGIPSAFLLHGYVGFLFGSIKANPWWSSVLIPVVFLFSAIVSGIGMVLIIYLLTGIVRRSLEMSCLDKLASFLFYALIVDFSLEILDFIHRLYQAEESIKILAEMISSRLFLSLVILQALVGTVLPLICLAIVSPAFGSRPLLRFPDELRRLTYLGCALLIQIGIFSTRWNVVIGGQLFSKSLRGLTVYKLELLGQEGLFTSIFLLLVPFVLLYIFVKILPPWKESAATLEPGPASGD